jgi:hypothetical protein
MTNKFKTLSIVAAALLGAAFMCQQVNAAPITGGISLSGGYTVNTGNLNTATAFSSFTGVTVSSTSGSFNSVTTGGAVTMNPFAFSPFPAGGVVPLWSTTAGSTASFDLTSLTSLQQPGDGSLTIKGTGTLHLAGFTDTAGSYLFTANSLGGTFSFSSSNAALPDGGITLALLGVALTGVEGLRRKLSK